MTESFNSMLGDHRAAIYLELLEYIIRLVMGKFQQRKVECEKWNLVIPPRINSKILKASRESRLLKMINAGEMEYELMGPDMTCAVKLREYTCACGRWQINGIPCCHAMAAISHYCGRDAVKDKVVEFVHQSLTKSAYMHTYRSMIHPLPDQTMWPDVGTHQIIPPPLHVQPGRPKLQRKRELDERPKEGRTGSVVCKSCNKIGHNKRTCINGKSVRKKRKSKNSGASSSHPHSIIGTSSSQPRT
ncbi:hypothetical protein EZV62_014374 [Acer yangbiense]|uniref:SWIM-type domain-containing protein n=1 Tax=Acer yangbiense TaxID=1000413 RepID=A0A5C7HRW6_9ROSI|nr:hypothetical protein EZV62_014374 [Acer yangbiense]